MMTRYRSIIAATLLMATSTTTHAYTECTGNITRIWTDGSTWIWFDTGLIWGLWPADDELNANGASRSKNIVNDRSDQLWARPFWTGLPPALPREEPAVFSLHLSFMKPHEGRGPKNDSRTNETSTTHQIRD